MWVRDRGRIKSLKALAGGGDFFSGWGDEGNRLMKRQAQAGVDREKGKTPESGQ